jgi:starch synthase
MDPLKICMVSAELTPFAKTGGLGDVAAALSAFLARRDHDVRLFVPLYSGLDRRGQEFRPVEFMRDIPLQIGHRRYEFSVFATPLPGSALPVYFLHCPALFDRPKLYTSDWDEAIRFLLLQRGALECCQRMGFAPDVVHCNDWHTGLVPLLLQTLYGWDRLFANARTMMTIHNIGYQGVFGSGMLEELGLAHDASRFYQEDLAAGRINFLKTGLLYADVLTTVSHTYAHEIQTAEYGAGLDALLRARADRLFGIVNGIDDGEWNPQTDPLIPAHFSADDLAGKAQCKQTLMTRLGLPYREAIPVLGIVSRLTSQKGFDLLFDTLPHFLAHRPLQVVALGSGEPKLEAWFSWLQSAFPGQVCFYRGYSNELAHLIEAGADAFLMPSRYEPCGLNQMYSLRYGTVPIVRKTGGLADTVELWDPWRRSGTGIVFEHFNTDGLAWALDTLLSLWGDRDAWRQMQQNGMRKNYSWDVQGEEYVELYRRLRGH